MSDKISFEKCRDLRNALNTLNYIDCYQSSSLSYFIKLEKYSRSSDFFQSVGGRKSREGDWPWLTNVVIEDSTCTGVILSPNWVLTSNCLEETNYTSSTGFVQYGNPDLNKTLKIEIEEIIPHPEFQIANSTRIYKRNDIALVKVKGEIEFNSTLHGVCIKRNLNHKEKEIAVFAGYGRNFYRVLNYNRTRNPDRKRLEIVKIFSLNFSAERRRNLLWGA